MPVIIGEFETVADTRAPQQQPDAGTPETNTRPLVIEPCAVAAAQRTLAVQSLRVWAH